MLKNSKWIAAYVLTIVLVNVGFSIVPLVDILGVMWPPMSLAVGLIFIVRDFAQRESGRLVLLAMISGLVISYLMADPYVAIASAVAFAVSEAIDYLVFTLARRPFKQRVVYSSFLSTPIDSAVFLLLIGQFSFLAVALMTVSKLVALILIIRSNLTGE